MGDEITDFLKPQFIPESLCLYFRIFGLKAKLKPSPSAAFRRYNKEEKMHVIHLQGRKETHSLNIPLDKLKKLADKTKSVYFSSSDALEVLAILLIYAALFGSLAFCTMKILDLIAMLIKLETKVRLFFEI